MKPLNLDNSPCTPTSSNCVIWQGPNIPCIKLCTGDTISDVVYKLATELCTILDYLKVENYDLSCFNLATCPPNNFQELVQFLIDRICALENIDPATVTSTTTISTTETAAGSKSPLVSNYLMTANSDFGGGTIKLVDYVTQIANEISVLIVNITTINNGISSLNSRVTTLETAPAPVFVIPSFILGCDIGTIIPVLPTGSTQDIDVVIERFINEEWCPYKLVFDTYSNLSNAILSQPIAGTDPAEAQKYIAPGTQMQVAYPTYVAAPTTLAEAINNLWLALDDTRNAGDELVTITAGDNITVTPVVSVVGANQVTDYTIAGKEAIVAAGDNVTVTSATVGNDTTYTVNAKESIVAAGTGISVSSVTVGNDTTYTVASTGAVDTGWQDLDGFSFYSGVTPPQCRRIGNVIYFRGTIVVPLDSPFVPGTVVTYTPTSYNAIMGVTPFTGAPGGVVLSAAGSVTFNNGSSVIPTSVLPGATNLDSLYTIPFQIATRPIDIDATYGTVLTTVATINISATKQLSLSVLRDNEITLTRGAGVLGNSPLRFIVSNVRVGDFLPNYIDTDSDIHNTPVDALSPLQTDTYNPLGLTWPFSCDAGEEDQIGGFRFFLDGLIAYI